MITGYEPTLSTYTRKTGYHRLLRRELGSLLSALSPDAISLDTARAMLDSDNFYVRYHAARLLAEHQTREARLLIQDVLTTGSTPSRASVTRHLHRLSWFTAESLLRQALSDPEESVHEAAVYALCDLREYGAYQLLVEALPNETDTVRAAAAWGLRSCHDSAAVPVLALALQATDPEVRIKALESLSSNNTSEAIPIVWQALSDPDPEVVYNAVLSLLELREEKCLPELIERIHQATGPHLEALLRGLFHASNYLHLRLENQYEIQNTLASALIDPYIPARMAAIWIVASMRDSEGLKIGYAHETDTTVKAHILRVSVCLMVEDAAFSLIEDALASNNPILQTTAAELQIMTLPHIHYNTLDTPLAPLNRIELAGMIR
jgi:HEAT repeat protein